MARLRRKTPLPAYTVRGCTLTKNNSKWCNRMCDFDDAGMGTCGRIAPHSLEGIVQKAIRAHNLKTGRGQA
jgi:hypothetical protein